MAWRIEYTAVAEDELKAMGMAKAEKIVNYLNAKIATDHDPGRFGRGLHGNLAGIWRYRVGDYRILCEIRDDKIIVLVLHAGHRSKIYGIH